LRRLAGLGLGSQPSVRTNRPAALVALASHGPVIALSGFDFIPQGAGLERAAAGRLSEVLARPWTTAQPTALAYRTVTPWPAAMLYAAGGDRPAG